MISDADAIEIKHPCSLHDTAVIPSFYTNKIPPTEIEKALFFKEIVDHNHAVYPYCPHILICTFQMHKEFHHLCHH